MMRKVIKPVANGHFEEVWEHQGPGAGQRRGNRKAPITVDRAASGSGGYRRARSHK